MALTNPVSNAELSSNPATGKVAGDTNPASTQKGALTKLRDEDPEIETAIGARKTTFDGHDHDSANPTGGGGQPIGTGGVVSIAPNGIDNAALASGSVTGGKTQAAAITAAKIGDGTVEAAQIGAPSVAGPQTIAAGTTWTINHTGTFVMFGVEADDSHGDDLEARFDSGHIYIKNGGGFDVPNVYVRYYGA